MLAVESLLGSRHRKIGRGKFQLMELGEPLPSPTSKEPRKEVKPNINREPTLSNNVRSAWDGAPGKKHEEELEMIKYEMFKYLRFPFPFPDPGDPIPPWISLTDVQQRKLFDLQIRMEAERAKIVQEADQRLAKLSEQKNQEAQKIIGG
jgi:hypothetical protein